MLLFSMEIHKPLYNLENALVTVFLTSEGKILVGLMNIMQVLLVNSVDCVNSSINTKVNILRKEYARFPTLSSFD